MAVRGILPFRIEFAQYRVMIGLLVTHSLINFRESYLWWYQDTQTVIIIT